MTKIKLRKIIGENIRKERIKRNMSIDELADLLGFSTSFVGLMERGQRGVTALNIYKISKIFDLSEKKLFEIPDDMKDDNENYHSIPVLRTKLQSLLHNCNETELDFLIATVKGVKSMHRAMFNMSQNDDEQDDEE